MEQKRTDERKACKTCAGGEHSDGGRTLRRHPDEGAFTRGDGRTDWCNHRRSSLWGRVNPEFGGGAIVKTPQVVNGGAQCGGVTERNDAGEGEIEHPQRLSQQPGYIEQEETTKPGQEIQAAPFWLSGSIFRSITSTPLPCHSLKPTHAVGHIALML